MSRRSITAAILFACLFSVAASHVAFGNTILYTGPFPGATVVYAPVLSAADQYVKESSLNPAHPAPLFGPPTVSGDSIDFNPTGFGAFASGAGGVDVNDGQLVFKIQAKPTFAINTMNFSEAGVTSLAGVGTNITHTDVSAVGTINILQIDGTNLNNAVKIPLNLVFTPLTATGNKGTFQLVADAGLGLSGLPWTGFQSLNLDQAITNAGIKFTKGATLISVDLDNTLLAQSEAGTLALIDKKDFGGVSITINPGPGGGDLPEPASLVLACLGLLGMVGIRRMSR
jgi:hypothetical protein